ncbi:tetratricopeptide repeat protein [Pseudoalteromonas luteoviolacea]|nr:tetratricopeptide repeat protein [Pseudoalteromonas luteoviolacea]KZN32730.1 hypothetical protein N483_26885 [Pseudoalteromonas luteoviolacea NCIMB 1944]
MYKFKKIMGLITGVFSLSLYAQANDFPESKRVLNDLCITLYSQKDYLKAQACFMEQVNRNAKNYHALGNLALVKIKNGDFKGAIETADIVLQQSSNSKQQASAAYNQGLAYERLKNYEAALGAYKKSNQLFSTKARASSVQRLAHAIADHKQGTVVASNSVAKTHTPPHTGNEQHQPRFKLSRNHLDNGLCEAFLAELNQSPWDELLKCKLPTIHNPDIKELVFTPIQGERIKEIDQLIYRGRQTWEQAWPDREKDYQLGYFRLGEAFFDANNDGKKEHVIRRLMPLQTCRPLEKGEAGNDVDVVSMSRNRVKQWEAMTKQQQIQQAQINGFYSSYTILEKNFKKGTFSAKGRFLIYQDKIYPTYPSGMSFKNIPDLNHSTWFSIAEFSGHISSKNTYGATPVCSYKLNDKK